MPRLVVLSLLFFLLICKLSDNNAYNVMKKPRCLSYDSTKPSIRDSSFQLFSRFPFNSPSSSSSNQPSSIPSSSSKTVLKELKITPEEVKEFKTDVIRSLSLMAAATGFAAVLSLWKGPSAAIEFSAGYILELCLSVDNLFVFLLLFEYFKVDKKNEDRVLRWGIIGAIILRGLFVSIGSVALEKFHQILLVFAIILGYSAYNIVFGKEDDEDEDLSKNQLVQLSKRFFPSTDKFDGNK